MFDIPAPPMPTLEQNWIYGISAAGIVVGVCMVFWGRLVHRAILALAGAGVAVLIASPVIAHTQFDPLAVRLVLVMVLAGLAAALARMIWGVFFSAVCLLGAVVALMTVYSSQVAATSRPAAEPDGTAWLLACVVYLRGFLQSLWPERSVVLLATLAPAGILPLLIAMLAPRFTVIVMSSLLGALLMMGGLILGATQMNANFWATSWANLYIPGIACGVLLLFGACFQGRGLYVEEKKKKEKEKEKEKQAKEAEAAKQKAAEGSKKK
jgi:hypothetical protein